MSVLVLVHPEPDGSLPRSAFEAVGAAVALAESAGTPLSVAVVGADVQAAADALATCGATRFIAAQSPELASARYSTDAAALESVCRAAACDIILAAGTSRMLRVLPGVAQRLGGRVDTHVTRVAAADGSVSASRWFYKQRIEATFSRSERPWVIAIEPGTQSPWIGSPGSVTPEQVTLTFTAIRCTVQGFRAPASGAQTVRPDADLLLVAGAGWTKKQSDGAIHAAEAADIILGFLRSAHASLGGSKSLVDQSGEGQAVLPFMTHLNQVGQTGASPRHRKGLATCCHGEEPHVVGWRFIAERRAVNLNPNCGWAQGKADVLYVADAFAVMARVNELLAAELEGAAR